MVKKNTLILCICNNRPKLVDECDILDKKYRDNPAIF